MLAIKFCESDDRESLEANERELAAILYEIGSIGEATNLLSDEIKMAKQEIPWKQIRGFRNRVVHNYKEIDISEVWLVVKRDLPKLIADIEVILQGME